MADLQKVFNDCKALYKNAFLNVKAMASAIAEILEKEGKSFDPRVTTGKFDVVLQYSLLQVAVSDFDFHRNELIFIRDLTEQGDFVNYVNSITKSNITWDTLYNATATDVRKMLNTAEPLLRRLSDEVVDVFVICDRATKHDYLADLEKEILGIIYGLSMMDGDVNSENYKTSILILEVMARIKAQKRK